MDKKKAKLLVEIFTLILFFVILAFTISYNVSLVNAIIFSLPLVILVLLAYYENILAGIIMIFYGIGVIFAEISKSFEFSKNFSILGIVFAIITIIIGGIYTLSIIKERKK